MQKKYILFFSLFCCCVGIFSPFTTYSQIATPEVINQQTPAMDVGVLPTNQSPQTELLSVDDTVQQEINESTDPLSVFDEPHAQATDAGNMALPLETESAAQIPSIDTSTMTPQPAIEQLTQPAVIATQKHTHVSKSHLKKEKLSRKLRREQRKKEKRERKQQQEAIPKTAKQPDASLDFDVENKTGKTVYATSFTYMKKRPFTRWRWDKPDVYKIEDDKKVTIALHPIHDEQDRLNTFGYLAVFDTAKEAEEAVFELTPDRNKLELDLLVHLKGKTVVLEVERYGKTYEYWDYDFVPQKKSGGTTPEIDFVVENRTGKTVLLTCFTFQKRAKGTWLAQKTKAEWTALDETRDDMSVWRFNKTPIIKLKPGESGMVDVDTIVEPRDRREVQGYLAVFDEDEHDKAEHATYELLPPENKIQLGKLVTLKGKKVVLEIEKYGTVGDWLDFTIKPVNHINFTKLDRSKVTKRSQRTTKN